MAQLKDTIVSGSLRATDTIYTTTLQTKTINALTENNSTTYGPGINGQVLKSNGTSVYWTTLGGASDYEVIDSSSARAIGTGTNLITERTIHYGLPTINNAHNYTSNTAIYAPTAGGTKNQILVSAGSTAIPTWKATANGAAYATSSNGELTFGTLPIAQGGTGATSFTVNSVIISGSSTTSPLTTRAIKNITAKGNLGWTSSSVDNTIVTTNTMAYWDGKYNSTSSNLTYCVKGAFGNLAIKDSLGANDIPSLAASKITSGTFDAARIPNLSTDKLTSGTLPVGRGGTGVTNTADARTLFLTATGNARIFYGTCDTADSTVAKVVTCSVYPDLQTGDILIVKFSHTNTGAVANLTLNVNNKGAKGIKKQYNNTLANLTHAGELRADTIAEFIYNGQYWILANADYNNTYNYSSLQSASGASRMAENTTNGGIGLHGYTLQLMTLNQAWSSIACTNGSTANNSGTTTQKTSARADFLLDAPILYMTDNKYVAPQTESNVSGYTAYACNFLYNTSGNVTLSIQQPVYLVGILNSDKVTFKLDENQWWTQSLPTQQDPQAKSNKIYILLGLAYSATNIYLLPYHPVYYHNGIRIQLLSGSGGGTGTWIGTEAPEEESYNLWVDTDEDATGAMVLRGDAIKMLNFTIASSKWTLHDGLYVTELPFGSTSGTRASTNASYTANGINVDDVVLSLQILTNKHLIQDGTLSWETSNGSLLLKSTQQITNTITGYVVLGTSMGFVPTIVAQNPVF